MQVSKVVLERLAIGNVSMPVTKKNFELMVASNELILLFVKVEWDDGYVGDCHQPIRNGEFINCSVPESVRNEIEKVLGEVTYQHPQVSISKDKSG